MHCLGNPCVLKFILRMYDQFLKELGLKLNLSATNLQGSSPFDIEYYFKYTELINLNFKLHNLIDVKINNALVEIALVGIPWII